MLECKELVKDYNYGANMQNVLKNINISIKQGDIITIMGESGSGKTTLLNCLALLETPTSGKIYYSDTLIDEKKEKELEKIRQDNIGYVFQNANLIPCLNVVENLIISIHDQQSYTLKRKRALEMLGLLGMINLEKKSISTLSGGEKQRVSILRALINTPKILFCDEPTGALDSKTSESVMCVLLKLCKKYSTTLVIVTHDINIGKLGNKQYVMEEGKLNAIS